MPQWFSTTAQTNMLDHARLQRIAQSVRVSTDLCPYSLAQSLSLQLTISELAVTFYDIIIQLLNSYDDSDHGTHEPGEFLGTQHTGLSMRKLNPTETDLN